MDQHPAVDNPLCCLINARETGLSSSLMGHLAQMQTLPLYQLIYGGQQNKKNIKKTQKNRFAQPEEKEQNTLLEKLSQIKKNQQGEYSSNKSTKNQQDARDENLVAVSSYDSSSRYYCQRNISLQTLGKIQSHVACMPCTKFFILTHIPLDSYFNESHFVHKSYMSSWRLQVVIFVVTTFCLKSFSETCDEQHTLQFLFEVPMSFESLKIFQSLC